MCTVARICEFHSKIILQLRLFVSLKFLECHSQMIVFCFILKNSYVYADSALQKNTIYREIKRHVT